MGFRVFGFRGVYRLVFGLKRAQSKERMRGLRAIVAKIDRGVCVSRRGL